jgi:hypothetical protein
MAPVETNQGEPREQLTVVRTQRFTRSQWDYLVSMRNLTGCDMAEYVRRLIEADRAKKEAKNVL